MGSNYGQAFGEAFPVDVSGRKPLPKVTPLPPRRPGDMLRQGGVDSIQDVLSPEIKPKVDASEIEAAKPKAEETRAALDTLTGTFTPNIGTGGLDTALGKAQALNAELAKVEGSAARAEAATGRASAAMASFGAATRSAASSVGGAITRTGVVTAARQNAPKSA